MSTLVDELLQDFEDSGSEAGDDRDDDGLGDAEGSALMGINGDVEIDAADLMSSDEDDEMEDADHDQGAKDSELKMQLGPIGDLRSVASLVKTLEPVLEVSTLPPCSSYRRDEVFTCLFWSTSPDSLARIQKIAFYKSHNNDAQTATTGNIEEHPEFLLLTQSNGLSTSIDSEMMIVHKFIRDHYTRFPELESTLSRSF